MVRDAAGTVPQVGTETSHPEQGPGKPGKSRYKAALELLERPNVLGYLLMMLAGFIILFFIAYPFAWGADRFLLCLVVRVRLPGRRWSLDDPTPGSAI